MFQYIIKGAVTRNITDGIDKTDMQKAGGNINLYKLFFLEGK